MGEPKGKLVTPVMYNPDDELRSPECDADDNLKVSTEVSALPTGASTSANQATIITALQLIDDLRNALGSVDTDDLQVDVKTAPTTVVIPAATEKLFGFESVIAKTKNVTATGTNCVIDSDDVPDGKIWKITHITTWNNSAATPTRIFFSFVSNATVIWIHDKEGSTAQYETIDKHVELYLNADDFIKVTHSGVTIGHICYLNIFGYEMNAP